MKQPQKLRKNGRFVLLCFLGFFGCIGTVDAFFVYSALSTNTGVVIEQPYEKGLAYNDVLEKAKIQPKLAEDITYNNGHFQWNAADQNGEPIKGADITVKFYRTVKDGYDFNTTLSDKGNGLYQSKIEFPLKGLWVAKVSAQWNGKTYHTSHQFMVE